MVRTGIRWLWSHRKLAVVSFLLFAFAALNVVAYVHAYAMTHFVDSGSRTEPPEALGFAAKVKVLCTGVRLPKPTSSASPADQGLPFAVHHFDAYGSAGLAAWHVPHPQAKGLVVLFHGYAACKASLLAEAKAFHDLGYAAFLVDFRGSGDSSGNVTTIGVVEAEDVLAAFHYVRSQGLGQPVFLFGQSMGSAAILRAVAIHGVQPQALILECPFDRLLTTVENRFAAMGLPAFPGARLLVFWGGVQHGFDGFAHDPVDYAKVVSCPVLLLHGDCDSRVSLDQARHIAQNLPETHRLEVLAGVGHHSYVAARPDLWTRAVSQFLAERQAKNTAE